MSAATPTSGGDLARAFLVAMNAREFATMSVLLATDAQYGLLPASMGFPPVSREAGVAQYKQFATEVVPDFKIEMDEIVEGKDKVWLHAWGTGTAANDGRPYRNEYIWMFDIKETTDGGVLATRAREFGDSAFAAEFFGKK